MRFGAVLPNMGPGSDPHSLAERAREAEDTGWDGVFVWDSVYIEGEGDTFDPWIALTAIALCTERIRIGTLVTPIARRRPWKLARETATLDHLSRGRLILPVGLGSLGDGAFSRVGEAVDRRVRAERLDEGLAILAGLWSGQPFSFHGAHFQLDEMTFAPPPVQSPRIPIWVVGIWPRPASMRRALRWDGVLPTKMNDDGSITGMTPDDVAALRKEVAVNRQDDAPFEIVIEGHTPSEDRPRAAAMVGVYAEAGATWWLENVWRGPGGMDGMRARLRQGPPRGI